MRLDQLLVDRGFFSSRNRAKSEIMMGNIIVDHEKITKAGKRFNFDVSVTVKNKSIPFVSRGALKLKGALESFHIMLEGSICIDLGASTGGFTEIMLLNGAKRVYSVDVGYGQLHWKLRKDSRVVVMERTNARHLKNEAFSQPVNFISGDLSFISLRHILPVISTILEKKGAAVLLIKPQFELEREKNEKGIVKDSGFRLEAVRRVLSYCGECGMKAIDMVKSSVKGTKGNQEYLIHVVYNRDEREAIGEDMIKKTVMY